MLRIIAYLYPQAPFSNNIPRSDTLFGALAWTIRLLYGRKELESLLEEFDHSIEKDTTPPFLISSLNVFFEDKNCRVLFFPRPMLPPPKLNIDDEQKYAKVKKFKKTSLLSRVLFEKLLAGELTEQQIIDKLGKDYFDHAGALLSKEEYEQVRTIKSLLYNGEIARNTLNRLSFSTAPSEHGQLFYQKVVSTTCIPKLNIRTGLFLLIDATEKYDQMLKSALFYICQKGIGGDTTIGRGHCEVSFEKNSLSLPQNGSRRVALSLFHPNEVDRRELKSRLSEVYGQLERRKGFLETSYLSEVAQVWKPTLLSFKEGSSFPDYGRKVYGALYKESKQRPSLDYKVRIYGLAYTVAMREAL
ncbi:MAG: type III-A CRISPR-associated RAMP protein Csm4 [Acidobacteriota bacterium]|nr:type III-A CRISPR-associated RAMP protein Csm4 [Blastocatellia bacterium]MDW8412374.1 type III-A CRISPR-associated RAMP protein Csm4 [Acidobacteriota bacterium]